MKRLNITIQFKVDDELLKRAELTDEELKREAWDTIMHNLVTDLQTALDCKDYEEILDTTDIENYRVETMVTNPLLFEM